jgi:hypothetical protein
MAYEYTNSRGNKYYLNKRTVTLRGSGHTQTIFYFTRTPGPATIDEVPEGYTVVESKRNALPVLKKK